MTSTNDGDESDDNERNEEGDAAVAEDGAKDMDQLSDKVLYLFISGLIYLVRLTSIATTTPVATSPPHPLASTLMHPSIAMPSQFASTPVHLSVATPTQLATPAQCGIATPARIALVGFKLNLEWLWNGYGITRTLQAESVNHACPQTLPSPLLKATKLH